MVGLVGLSVGSSVHKPPLGFSGASLGRCPLLFSPAVESKLLEGLELKVLVFHYLL